MYEHIIAYYHPLYYRYLLKSENHSNISLRPINYDNITSEHYSLTILLLNKR